MATCIEKLENKFAQGNLIAVGLDPAVEKIPSVFKRRNTSVEEMFFAFNREIIEATADLVSAFKPNAAFYEAEGEQGFRALKRTADYLKENYPDIALILDAKRADIGSTNSAYATAIFDELGMDAVTVHPYLGKEALQPFLDRADKGIFVLVKTSNPGAGEFQDLKVAETGEPLYKVVAKNVATSWNHNKNCGIVVGATFPDELASVRKIIGDIPILIPGIGAQGGDVGKTVRAGKNSRGSGMVISSSRAIIYASTGTDFAEAARKATESLSAEIKKYL